MPCGKDSMTWKRALAMANRQYPRLSLNRRRKVAGSIVGGLRAAIHVVMSKRKGNEDDRKKGCEL